MIGEAVVQLGGGRAKKEDKIDHAVGVEVLHKVGDYIEKSQKLFKIHARKAEDAENIRETLLASLKWSADPVLSLPLFYEMIRN
jgi:pyrimidine-nucleoside phosphorylase